MATAMQADGAKAILQLTHAGRFANQAILDYYTVYGPSPQHLHTPIDHQVLEMSPRKIKQVVRQYGTPLVVRLKQVLLGWKFQRLNVY